MVQYKYGFAANLSALYSAGEAVEVRVQEARHALAGYDLQHQAQINELTAIIGRLLASIEKMPDGHHIVIGALAASTIQSRLS